MLGGVHSARHPAATTVVDVGVQVDLAAVTEHTIAVLVSERQARQEKE
jgi:hypothetical protein